jgi:hypothetical protein
MSARPVDTSARGRLAARRCFRAGRRPTLLPMPAIVAFVAVACSSDKAAPATDVTSIIVPISTPRPPPTDDDRQAASLMHRMFDLKRGPDEDVIRQMVELGHPGLAAPLVEITGFSFDASASEPIGDALFQLTGENRGGGFESQAAWLKWLSGHPEFEPVAGYDNWKGEFTRALGQGQLLDDSGVLWNETETGLVAANATGRVLERANGIESFWFGCFAFRPHLRISATQ